MNIYRPAREFCLQFFFHTQIPIFKELGTNYADNTELEETLGLYKETTNTLLDSKLNKFASELISNTIKNSEKIEDTIVKNLTNWKIDRLSKVDKTILMMSCAEILYHDTKANIVINEAVELGKKFGSQDSASFL